MGFFTLDQDDVQRYIAKFTAWLEQQHGGSPRRRMKVNADKVLVSGRNPISKTTWPIGWAWVELSESRDRVQAHYQHYYDWEIVESFPPRMSPVAASVKQEEEGARTRRAKENDPMRKDHHANSNVICDKGKEEADPI